MFKWIISSLNLDQVVFCFLFALCFCYDGILHYGNIHFMGHDLMTNVGPEARPVEKHWFKEYKVNCNI